MKLPLCPTCGKPFIPIEAVAMPFCSQRCRQIDLGRWLDERNTLPVQKPEECEADELPPGGRNPPSDDD